MRTSFTSRPSGVGCNWIVKVHSAVRATWVTEAAGLHELRHSFQGHLVLDFVDASVAALKPQTGGGNGGITSSFSARSPLESGRGRAMPACLPIKLATHRPASAPDKRPMPSRNLRSWCGESETKTCTGKLKAERRSPDVSQKPCHRAWKNCSARKKARCKW